MLIRCVCRQKYNVKDSLIGQTVRCRKCGEHILVQSPDQTVATPAAPAVPVAAEPAYAQPGLPADDPNSLGDLSDNQMSIGPAFEVPSSTFPTQAAPPGPRPKTKVIKVDYSYVNLGLRLIFAGTLVSILCGVAGVITIASGIVAVAALLMLGVFAGIVLSMVGYVFCIFVPARTGARPLIIAATICNGLNIIVSLMRTLVTASNASAEVPLLDFLSMVLSAAAMILFLLFLKKVAEYVENAAAAHDAWSLLIFYIVVACISIGFVLSMFVVVPALTARGAGIYVIVGILSLLIVAIIWLVHFMMFINDLEFKKAKRRSGSRIY